MEKKLVVVNRMCQFEHATGVQIKHWDILVKAMTQNQWWVCLWMSQLKDELVNNGDKQSSSLWRGGIRPS